MNKFLKELMTLATELNEAEGFNALTIINDMELLYDKHVAELKKLHIADVSGSLPTDEEISKQAKKYDVEDMNDAINRIGGFIVGAKWMRDLISGNDH